MKNHLRILALLAATAPAQAQTLALQSPANAPVQTEIRNWGAEDLRAALIKWLNGQGRDIPDPASIGPLDPRMSLPACDRLEITPRGASAATFQLRCEGPTQWTHILRAGMASAPVAVRAPEAAPTGHFTIIVPKMDLPAGTVLTADVLEERQVNNPPASQALKSLQDAVGLRLAAASGPGVALTTRSVARAPLVAKGENVTLVAGGDGFEISAPGRSEQDGYEGDLISVKNLKTGAVLKGRLERGKTVSVMKL